MEDKKSPKVVICGGGIMGCATAYYLSQRGVTSTVVERNDVAGGASGKAGGFLALDWSDGSAIGPLARKSFELHQSLPKALSTDIGYRGVDTLSVSVSEKAPTKTKSSSKKKAKTDDKPPLPWLDGKWDEESGQGAVIDSKCRNMGTPKTTAQVSPNLLTKAFLSAAEKKGSTLIIAKAIGLEFDTKTQKSGKKKSSNRKVIGVKVEHKDKKVEIISADVVVIAMGPWSQQAIDWVTGASVKVPRVSGHKAHSIVLRPKAPLSAHCLFLQYQQAKGKALHPEVYPRPNGEVYVCGLGEPPQKPEDPESVVPTEGACARLKVIASQLSSALAEAKQEAEQACYLPETQDGDPLIGKFPSVENLYLATGHSCWGILLGPATGLCLSELIVDGKCSSVDLHDFDPQRS